MIIRTGTITIHLLTITLGIPPGQHRNPAIRTHHRDPVYPLRIRLCDKHLAGCGERDGLRGNKGGVRGIVVVVRGFWPPAMQWSTR